MERKQKIVIIRETTLSSVVSDIVSFGVMCASFWFNYTFIDGNNWLDALLFISFFLFSMGKLNNWKRLKELGIVDDGGKSEKAL